MMIALYTHLMQRTFKTRFTKMVNAFKGTMNDEMVTEVPSLEERSCESDVTL